ncbi:hypothetical protein [Streptomyces sp. S.PB5]|uniref:hypothetical protein n=1 Tax=Streptomyces sp. S.PB5 TaxID=3020844 RepID=UPI0025B1C6D8|nr:hypothetical protein [Streptomyces sp. S.PB5]MDN3027974.1 hypothetical protein [Streptomyces sp. S.PB5]
MTHDPRFAAAGAVPVRQRPAAMSSATRTRRRSVDRRRILLTTSGYSLTASQSA